MKKKLASLVIAGLGCLGLVQTAQAVDVKFNFTFLDFDASVQGFLIIDDSVLSNIYNGGTTPANGGLVDLRKVKEISLHYDAGEFASGGGDFTLADYSYLRWTSYVPLDFYSADPAISNIAWQWENTRACGSTSATGVFALGRATGSAAPTEVATNCMAGTEADIHRQPLLHSLYLDTSYVATTAVPEPSTYALLAVGLIAIGLSTLRRKL